jgi:hypothetical protein
MFNTIAFKRPAATDIAGDASMTFEDVERIRGTVVEKGNVCCIVHGIFQTRKV